jgi:hypothetical protein
LVVLAVIVADSKEWSCVRQTVGGAETTPALPIVNARRPEPG